MGCLFLNCVIHAARDIPKFFLTCAKHESIIVPIAQTYKGVNTFALNDKRQGVNAGRCKVAPVNFVKLRSHPFSFATRTTKGNRKHVRKYERAREVFEVHRLVFVGLKFAAS